jgi:hypothetical protein
MKKCFLITLAIVTISCADNPVPKPEKLLDVEEMENILYDVSILQATETHTSNTESVNINISEFIYKKYAIDSTVFFQNQKYYSANIRKYNKMYENVLDRIQIQKNEIDTLLKVDKTKKIIINK